MTINEIGERCMGIVHKLIIIGNSFSGLSAFAENDNHSKTMYVSQQIPSGMIYVKI